MESEKKVSLEEIKAMDLVSYLASLGIEPIFIRGNLFWYNSPLRIEKTPSFKINRRTNLWVDYGERKGNGKFNGGTIIDFAIQFRDCTIGELMSSFSVVSTSQFLKRSAVIVLPQESESKIKVVFERNLWRFSLLDYLKFRRISIPIAEQFCREIHYEIGGRSYFGIGFRNNSGGFEIRNPFAKVSSTPKDITTFDNRGDEVVVFEGFMDFLSFLTIHHNQFEFPLDFVVLNGVTLFERAREFMEKHKSIRLYLDNDNTGKECAIYATSLDSRYTDESSLYKNHKDLNMWHTDFGSNRIIDTS